MVGGKLKWGLLRGFIAQEFIKMIKRSHREVDSLEVTLLVHDFGSFEESRQRPKQQVLDDGFRLVAEAVSWNFVTCPSGQPINTYSTEEKKRNAFTYNKEPPVVSAAGTVPVLKEWGSPFSEDEIFTINNLEEFQTEKSIEIEGRRLNGWDIDTTSLHEIIPQPHLHPSPFLLTVPPPKGQPFNRNKPMFVAPYSNFSLQDHARVAWLIPIRGIFPWSDCTRASLFNSPMPSSVADDLMSWNRASVLKFWQFLLDLQKSGSLGALGLSLHAAKLPKSSNSDDRRRAVITNAAVSTTPTNLLPQSMEHRRRYSTVDCFKIYHDASRAFYVRKAVDSWSYHFGPDSTKVRVLKGARFPLLDEVSTAILVC